MIHLSLPWRPRTSASTTGSGRSDGGCETETETVTVTVTSTSSGIISSSYSSVGSNSISNCCGLSRLMKRLKIKKRSKMLQPAAAMASRQCRGYDPLSYSLNFDTTDFVDDDYYKFYAFSSRFVAAASVPPTDYFVKY